MMSLEQNAASTSDPSEGYLARAGALAPLIEEAAGEIERQRQLTPEVVAALAEGGFFRLLLPRALGGAELCPSGFFSVIEEIASHDASTAWCLGQANGCAMTGAYLEADVAREVFGRPDGIVAWGPPGPGTASPAPGGYRLSGQWSFASGIRHASWLGAHVAVIDKDGSARRRPDGGAVLRTLLFPKSSAQIEDTWRVVGLRGTGSDTYKVNDLFVPERFTVLREPTARPRQGGKLYGFSASNLYSSGFAGVALGVARRVFDSLIELARDKIPRGARRTMRDDNVVQFEVAQCAARLRSARAYLLATLDEIWRDLAEDGRLDLDQNVRIRLASTWAIHQARDVVELLYHAAGATAIFVDQPFERRFRDVHAVAQQYQGRQTHFATVGQVLLGLPPDAAMFTF